MNLKEIHLCQLPEILNELAHEVKEKDFVPQKIVFIEKGGVIPAYIFENFCSGELVPITAKRPKSRRKKISSRILPFIPIRARYLLRKIELHIYLGKNDQREVTVNPKYEFKARENILIVDDSLDSGSTLLSVKNRLLQFGCSPERIKVLVINTTIKNRKIEPDFVFYNEKICIYPWSRDSQEFNRFNAIYAAYESNRLIPDLLLKSLSL
jgi:hypoxanthine phosphoribosyltransferase